MNWFASNFNPYREPITVDGITYRWPEARFQAMKTDDLDWKRRIANVGYPGEAKRLGNCCPLRSDWEELKYGKMIEVQRERAIHDEIFAQQLLHSSDEDLIEWNTWHDNNWGSCTCRRCEDKEKINSLQKALIAVREELRRNHYPCEFAIALHSFLSMSGNQGHTIDVQDLVAGRWGAVAVNLGKGKGWVDQWQDRERATAMMERGGILCFQSPELFRAACHLFKIHIHQDVVFEHWQALLYHQGAGWADESLVLDFGKLSWHLSLHHDFLRFLAADEAGRDDMVLAGEAPHSPVTL